MGPNLFQFKFQLEFDMNWIMKGGPWSFDNQLLLLQMWKKGMNVGNIRMESASLWVQIWGAPFEMISPQVAREVGSRLGEVEEVEWKKKKDDINMFMRVGLALPITKPSVVEDLLLDRMVRGRGYLSNIRDCLCFATSVESLVMT